VEELYDTQTDPDEFKNLANDPKYADKLNEMRAAFHAWRSTSVDMGSIPEKEMLANWWNGESSAPQTASPTIVHTNGGIRLHCDTGGASIGYQIVKGGQSADKVTHKILSYDFASMGGRVAKNGEDFQSDPPWVVYSRGKSIALTPGDTLIVKAKRIGYEESTVTHVENDKP
jgi:hypothetical protein